MESSHGPPHLRRESYAQRRAVRDRQQQWDAALGRRGNAGYAGSDASSTVWGGAGTSVYSGISSRTNATQSYSPYSNYSSQYHRRNSNQFGADRPGDGHIPRPSPSPSNASTTSMQQHRYHSPGYIHSPVPTRLEMLQEDTLSPNDMPIQSQFIRQRQPPPLANVAAQSGTRRDPLANLRSTQAARASPQPSRSTSTPPLRLALRTISTFLPLSLAIPLIFVFLSTLKLLVGLGGYSGIASSPRFGDFEAQRFWMDLTVNHQSPADWYQVGGIDDGDWWRLDYPPLTAYVSWVFGKM